MVRRTPDSYIENYSRRKEKQPDWLLLLTFCCNFRYANQGLYELLTKYKMEEHAVAQAMIEENTNDVIVPEDSKSSAKVDGSIMKEKNAELRQKIRREQLSQRFEELRTAYFHNRHLFETGYDDMEVQTNPTEKILSHEKPDYQHVQVLPARKELRYQNPDYQHVQVMPTKKQLRYENPDYRHVQVIPTKKQLGYQNQDYQHVQIKPIKKQLTYTKQDHIQYPAKFELTEVVLPEEFGSGSEPRKRIDRDVENYKSKLRSQREKNFDEKRKKMKLKAPYEKTALEFVSVKAAPAPYEKKVLEFVSVKAEPKNIPVNSEKPKKNRVQSSIHTNTDFVQLNTSHQLPFVSLPADQKETIKHTNTSHQLPFVSLHANQREAIKKDHNSQIEYGTCMISVQSSKEEVSIGLQYIQGETAFHSKQCVFIAKPNVSKLIKILQHFTNNPIREKRVIVLPGGKQIVISDVYREKYFIGIRSCAWYDKIPQPTRNGINMTTHQSNELIEKLLKLE